MCDCNKLESLITPEQLEQLKKLKEKLDQSSDKPQENNALPK